MDSNPKKDFNFPNSSNWFWFPLNQNNLKRDSPVGKKLNENYALPYFLGEKFSSSTNQFEALDNAEFFFGMPGGKVKAHTDQICNYVLSIQFSGRKKWKLGMFSQNASNFKDHTIAFQKILDETPIYEFVLNPGEVFLFPPGMVHATEIVGGDDEIHHSSSLCSASFSMQLSDPPPDKYLRRFRSNIASNPNGCKVINITSFLFLFTFFFLKKDCYTSLWNYYYFGESHPENFSLEYNKELFEKIDVDKNGKISKNECKIYFQNYQVEEVGLRGNLTNNFFLFIDSNQDDFVDFEEFNQVRKEIEGPIFKMVNWFLNDEEEDTYQEYDWKKYVHKQNEEIIN